MKKYLFILLAALSSVSLTSCDTDYESYPPQFADMVFESEAAIQNDTVTAGQTFQATLNMATGQQNVYLSGQSWLLDKEIKPSATSLAGGGLLPCAQFNTPLNLEEGWHEVKVELTYGVTGNESREMKNYSTATGLKVEYTQPWAGAVGHYVFTCTKKIYVKAAPQTPEEEEEDETANS